MADYAKVINTRPVITMPPSTPAFIAVRRFARIRTVPGKELVGAFLANQDAWTASTMAR